MAPLTRHLMKALWRRRTLRHGWRQPSAEHILAIASTGHGASLAYLGRDGTVRSSVLDRWSGSKNTLLLARAEEQAIRHPQSPIDRELNEIFTTGFGRFPEIRCFEAELSPWLDWLLRGLAVRPHDIDIVVACESHFATSSLMLGGSLGRWFPRARFVRDLEHHEIHQGQAFWQSGLEEAAVLTLDTCGEHLKRVRGKLAGTISRWRRDGRRRVLREFRYPEASSGMIYDIFTFHLGFVQGEQGKTMGLAAYGQPELFEQLRGDLELRGDGSFRFLPADRLKPWLCGYVAPRRPGEEWAERHLHVAYAAQAIVERIVSNAFRAALEVSGLPDLAYAGGVALNSVANEIACNEARPRRLYIAPNAGDTGQALGAALIAAHEIAGWPPPEREMPEYLGPPYEEAELAAAASRAGVPLVRPADIAAATAEAIAGGAIVACFAERAEHGPRALGNRSILCDPRRPGMKDHLNARVKHRESFRPFAPTVLEEHAADWFHFTGRSSYMLRVAPVRAERRQMIPAVVHVDGSARLQTVSRSENPRYYRLIEEFHRRTGVPLVLNTSFNLAGKPIVETPADAVACFAETEIDVLALGPFLLSKRPPGPAASGS